MQMAPVSSKLLLLEEEEEESELILSVGVAATAIKRKDGTGGGYTPSFKNARDTKHILPSCS